MKNITKQELDNYIKSIGGLESGYGDRYWGKNKIRKFLFNIMDWVFRIASIDKKNPFRSKIDNHGFFAVGPGWYGIIKAIIEESIVHGWDKEVCQVKEKFGGLRFYINSAPDKVHDIIDKYEDMSYHICEECGKSGAVRYGGWIRTLCDKHNNKK